MEKETIFDLVKGKTINEILNHFVICLAKSKENQISSGYAGIFKIFLNGEEYKEIIHGIEKPKDLGWYFFGKHIPKTYNQDTIVDEKIFFNVVRSLFVYWEETEDGEQYFLKTMFDDKLYEIKINSTNNQRKETLKFFGKIHFENVNIKMVVDEFMNREI